MNLSSKKLHIYENCSVSPLYLYCIYIESYYLYQLYLLAVDTSLTVYTYLHGKTRNAYTKLELLFYELGYSRDS